MGHQSTHIGPCTESQLCQNEARKRRAFRTHMALGLLHLTLQVFWFWSRRMRQFIGRVDDEPGMRRLMETYHNSTYEAGESGLFPDYGGQGSCIKIMDWFGVPLCHQASVPCSQRPECSASVQFFVTFAIHDGGHEWWTSMISCSSTLGK